MAKLGILKPCGPGDFWSDLRGNIRSLNFKADIRIETARDPHSSPNAPSHRVSVRGADGEEMEVGSAWSKTINRGPNNGETFLSVTLDDPSFAHPLNFAVFKEGEIAMATWRRRQEQAA